MHPLKRIVTFLASLQMTVYSLLAFMILVIWGTIFQAAHGLYAAQKAIFHAWIFWVGDLMPLPGLIFIGALLALNLVMALAVRIKWRLGAIGLILIHLGLILFLAGGFWSRQLSQESFLTLAEGESASFANSGKDWEIAIWPQAEVDGTRTVSAMAIQGMKAGEKLTFKTFSLDFTVLAALANCQPMADDLQPLAVDPEAEKNLPGLRLQASDGSVPFILHGAQTDAHNLKRGETNYQIQLRPRRFPLPVQLKLLDFRKVTYPGSEIPKSYESQLQLTQTDGFAREVLVSMNKPLRVGAYTFYQSSYDSVDGRERSTLSVVHNSGRLFPYYASLLTFLGLLWHALLMLWRRRLLSSKKRGDER